jgi:hypothetical protein
LFGLKGYDQDTSGWRTIVGIGVLAVLERIEEGFSKTSEGEAFALGYALHMLTALRHIAEREIGEQKRTGT